MKQPRDGFSISALIAALSIVACGLDWWIAYAKTRIQNLLELRQQGAIVILRDGTPAALQAVGIGQLSPLFDVPTVELYVTPVDDNAYVGVSETLLSRDKAQSRVLEQAETARKCGADDIQLILVDSFDAGWMVFAETNSLATIGESKDRYVKRLRANQESGANINP